MVIFERNICQAAKTNLLESFHYSLNNFSNYKMLSWGTLLTFAVSIYSWQQKVKKCNFYISTEHSKKNLYIGSVVNILRVKYARIWPTNTPGGFHVETTWKRSFPRRFNVETMWCVCRTCILVNKDRIYDSVFIWEYADQRKPVIQNLSLQRCLSLNTIHSYMVKKLSNMFLKL